jgi:hypothetical protein
MRGATELLQQQRQHTTADAQPCSTTHLNPTATLLNPYTRSKMLMKSNQCTNSCSSSSRRSLRLPAPALQCTSQSATHTLQPAKQDPQTLEATPQPCAAAAAAAHAWRLWLACYIHCQLLLLQLLNSQLASHSQLNGRTLPLCCCCSCDSSWHQCCCC